MADETTELGDGQEKETPSEPADKEEGKPESAEALKVLEDVRKATEALKAEKEKLLEDVKGLRGERRELKSKPKPAETQTPPSEEDDLTTAEGWDKRIEKKSRDAVAPVLTELDKFKELQRKKALKSFVSAHPEYSADKDPEDAQMNSLLDIAKRLHGDTAELDSDSYLDALQDAWAVKHRTEIETQAEANRKAKAQAEDDTADVATGGGSPSERAEPDYTNATPSDYRSAKIAGMDIKKYLKLKAQMEETSVGS